MIPFILNAYKVDGNALVLTDQSRWICEYAGFNPPKASLYSSAMAGMNGAKFQGSRLNTRNIVLTFTIFHDIPASRLQLYDYFRIGDYVKLEYRGNRNVWIDGYIETIQNDQFKSTPHKQVMQVSILCYDPDFKDLDSVSVAKDPNSPTLSVYYGGSVPTGFEADFSFTGAITKIALRVGIAGGILTINEAFDSGDFLHISTVKGKKTVKKTSGGSTTNIMSSVQYGSTWPQLKSGNNSIVCAVGVNDDPQNYSAVYKFTPLYEEV